MISSKSHLLPISIPTQINSPSRSDLPSSDQARPISVKLRSSKRSTSSDCSTSTNQDELQSSTDQDPRAPIKHWSRPTSSDQDPRAPICLSVGLSMWVCLCVGVFVCGCGCVCLCASEEKEDEERKTEFVGCARRRERKKGANEN